MNKLGVYSSLVVVMVLSACRGEPPVCSSDEAVDTLREILVSNADQGLDTWKEQDPKGLLNNTFKNVSLTAGNILSDGYDKEAKKRSCKGDFKLAAENKEAVIDLNYTLQTIESGDSKFMAEIQNARPIIGQLRDVATSNFSANRYSGTWAGIYKCSGIDNASSGAQGPFQSQVKMIVAEGGKAHIERVTKGGGKEMLEGILSDSVYLVGRGQNTPDDGWKAEFKGEIQGKDFHATGTLSDPATGEVWRNCDLQLALDLEAKE